MSIEQTLASAQVLAADEGQHLEFLNNLVTIKAAAGNDRAMSVVEFLAPRSFGPPEHTHRNEDEFFVVLEGEMKFLTGGQEILAGAGACAYLPRAVPHTFQVLSESARMLTVTAVFSEAPRFDEMVTALGTPTDDLVIPEPVAIDPMLVADVCRQHSIDIVGPPPAPLE